MSLNSVYVDSAGLVQAGELTRGLLLLTSATRCLTVHTVTAPFSKYRGSGSTSPRSIQKSSLKKQVMFRLLLRHRWSHCMSLELCKVYLVSVNMQTLLSYFVLYQNLGFGVLLFQCLLCSADTIVIVGIMLSGLLMLRLLD